MLIPDAEFAFIPPEKLGGYLLNPDHPVGGPKARWFLAVGYHPESPERLAADLLALVRTSSEFVDEQMRFGVKYTVRGELDTPSAGLAAVVTVWITEPGMPGPRLITAYPDERQADE